MKRASVVSSLAVLALAALGFAGCGEREQTTHYQEGRYRGKPDTPAFQAAPFNGNEQQYDKAMRERAQNQNEYTRIQ
jgi:hypothetical protein